MIKRSNVIAGLMLLALLVLAGCNTQQTGLPPIEREQIENIVQNYMTRDTNIPAYDVAIEEVADNWARVSVKPVNTETQPDIIYLQQQIESATVPPLTPTVQPGHEAEVQAPTGWTIIAGPQADFSPSELDEAGVPMQVRP